MSQSFRDWCSTWDHASKSIFGLFVKTSHDNRGLDCHQIWRLCLRSLDRYRQCVVHGIHFRGSWGALQRDAQSSLQELKMRYLRSELLTNQERCTIIIKVSWSKITNFCFTLKPQVESHKCKTLQIIVSPMGNTLKKRDSKDSLFK